MNEGQPGIATTVSANRPSRLPTVHRARVQAAGGGLVAVAGLGRSGWMSGYAGG